MKRTKKGITLVELVICCAIIVLIGGAATALLMSGEHLFSSSANSASNQMELDVLQSHMMNIIPSAKNVGMIKVEENELQYNAPGNYIYLDGNDLVIRIVTEDSNANINIKETKIRSVGYFDYDIIYAGGDAPNMTTTEAVDAGETTEATEPTAYTGRAQFIYTVTFLNGQTYQGGFVINNLSYLVVYDALKPALTDTALGDQCRLEKYPICVSVKPSSNNESGSTE